MRNIIARPIFGIGPFLLVLFATWSYGQVAVGTIKGIVTDPNGAVVPNAILIFESHDENGKTVPATSNSSGEYAVANLSPGNYRITGRFNEMFYTNPNVIVRPGEITTLKVVVSYEANCPLEKDIISSLLDADRTEIVSSILQDGAGDSLTANGRKKYPPVLSLETIKPEWIRPDQRTRLILMTQEKIQEKADRKGDFLYLSFVDWQVGTACVVVTLNTTWAVGKNSRSLYLSGGGTTYLYKRENGKWVGKRVGGWLS
jgi:hypothetical protein